MQHAIEKGNQIGWNETYILHVETNSRYNMKASYMLVK
jgi:hypothetical protein